MVCIATTESPTVVFPGSADIINKDSLNLKMVDDMLQDKSGTIWFASGMLPGSEGLISFDGKALTSYKLNGQRWIYNIVEDNIGNLWLATRHNGVVKYDGHNFRQVSVGGTAGLALLMDRSGNIWFSCGQEGEGPLWRYDGKSYTNFGVKDGLKESDIWTIVEDKGGNIWVGTGNLGLYKYSEGTFTKFSE